LKKGYPIRAPLPADEAERLNALRRYEILDTPQEQSFDDITLLATLICKTPIAQISLVDETRVWLKSKRGTTELESSRDTSFCAYAILQPDVFVVEDALADPRFAKSPLVTGQHKIRFYAGVPILSPDGYALGVLCVMEQVPRDLSEYQREALRALNRQVMANLELRRTADCNRQNDAQSRSLIDALCTSEMSYRRLFEAGRDGVLIIDFKTGRITDVNPFMTDLLGYSKEEMLGKTVAEISPSSDLEYNQVMLERLKIEGFVRYDDRPLEKKDGRIIAVEFVSNVYEVAGDSVIQCNIRDITELKRNQEQLQKFVTTQASILNALPANVALLDHDGVIVWVNEHWRKFAVSNGLKTENFCIGQNYIQICERATGAWAEEGKPVAAGIKQVLQGEIGVFDIEYPCHSPTVERWFLLRMVRVGKDQVSSAVVMHIDITERKKAEEQLLWKSALLEALVNSSPDGLLVVGRNADKIVQNQRMAEMWKIPKEFADDVDDRMQLEWVSNQVEDPAQFTERVAYLHDHPDETSRDEIELKDRRFFDRYSAPVRSKDGRYYGRFWTFRDVTERKKAEASLRLQSSALEAAANAIVITDRKGTIEWANAAFTSYTGYSLEDALGKKPNLLKSGKHEAGFYHNLWETVSSGKVWHGEITNKRKDGTLYDEEMTITPIKNKKGEIEHFIAVKSDITERNKLEAQFMRAQRMESIGTLAGGVAHDLNNILAPIMMSIDLLKGESDSEQTRQILETIETSAKRGADIVRQVLSFARGVEGERVEVQPKHLLKDLENIIKDTFPKNIRLKFIIARDTWTILGDATQVHQILLNLCVNARDAMPNGGDLTVGLENSVVDAQYAAMNAEAKTGRYVQISVTDTGTGIPPNVLERIFDPFFTTKELGKGTGLGLSTVKGIIKSHDGFINVYSEPGKGTSFRVYLPSMAGSPEQRKAQTQKLRLPRGNGETILVVDDEVSVLTITCQTLLAYGYRALKAADGAEALAVYATHKDEIAVVLTDMMMPILAGQGLIHALRRINPGVRIIAASGLNTDGNTATVTDGSVKHFIIKPYTAATLLKTLQQVLLPSEWNPSL